jgi:hypothetical protein
MCGIMERLAWERGWGSGEVLEKKRTVTKSVCKAGGVG